MPTVKKEAYDAIVRKLEAELGGINGQIRRRTWEIKKLAQDQARNKRERGALTELINLVKGKAAKEVK